MSQIIPLTQPQQHLTHTLLEALEAEFPNISTLPIDHKFLEAPSIQKLVNLIKFAIPVHTYQPELLALYEHISETYYAYIFRNLLKTAQHPVEKNDVSLSEMTSNLQPATEPTEKRSLRTRMNYLALARFIDSYNNETEVHVNQQVIRQGQIFQTWQSKEVLVSGGVKQTPRKGKPKERQQLNVARQKVIKGDNTVNILIGKNISREIVEMKNELIKRAKNNRLLDENQLLTEIEKASVGINYILNRLTEEYFQDFLAELRPYATHEIYSFVLAERLIEKVLEEHNFMKLYSKLVKRLKKCVVQDGEKPIRFKTMFTDKLQLFFYKLIRRRQWADKEQFYKKQLLGLSIFLGELIHQKILSKAIFPDIFYELITGYIHQYYHFQNNKAFYYHEIYVECIVKIIEGMGVRYDHLLKNISNTNIESITNMLLASDDNEETNFTQICDFIEILKEINKRLPSQRFKIAFLLEDFRYSKAIKKQESNEENNQFEIVKDALALDHESAHSIGMIEQMIGKCDPKIVMKDYYFQFAEGNAKHVAKNIQTFKIFMHLPGIYEAAVTSLRNNLEDLSMIDCDFPFLAQGIAKVMKQVCDYRRCEWKQLQLYSQDEDIVEFIQRIQNRYFKMIIQD